MDGSRYIQDITSRLLTSPDLTMHLKELWNQPLQHHIKTTVDFKGEKEQVGYLKVGTHTPLKSLLRILDILSSHVQTIEL